MHNRFLDYQLAQSDPPSQDVEQHLLQEKQQIQDISELLNRMADPQTIQSIIPLLTATAQAIQDFTLNLKYIYTKLTPEFWFKTLKIFLQGYDNPKTFKDGLYFEGLNIHSKAVQGSTGASPSFQVFEAFFGIRYDGSYKAMQDIMQVGMVSKHRELIQMVRQHSLIRMFALATQSPEVKQAYNDVIKSYVTFNTKHANYVAHFLEKMMVKQNPQIDLSKTIGLGNAPVGYIKERDKFIEKFVIY